MSRFRTYVVVAVLLTVATLAAAPVAGEVPDCTDGNVIDLELARTQDRAEELIGACDEAGLDVLRDGLRADNLLFMPLYVLSVATWCALGARRLPWSSSGRREVVIAAAVAIVAAGAFDLAENLFLGRVVDAAGASDAVGPAFAASAVKWVLVLFAVPVSVVAMVRCVKAAVRRDEAIA